MFEQDVTGVREPCLCFRFLVLLRADSKDEIEHRSSRVMGMRNGACSPRAYLAQQLVVFEKVDKATDSYSILLD